MTEAFTVAFFLDQPHRRLIPRIEQALDNYIALVGLEPLKFYIDEEGDTPPVTRQSLAQVRRERFSPEDGAEDAGLTLIGSNEEVSAYEFYYYGMNLPDTENPDYRNPISFRFSPAFIEAKGLAAVADFARELAEFLPFTFGYANPALAYEQVTLAVTGPALRYPELDVTKIGAATVDLGDRAAGVYWLSFLGERLTRSLQGIEGLQARLDPPIPVSPVRAGG